MTTLHNLFEWLEALPTATALRESDYGYPYLLAGHVVGMLFFAGLILMMDLRLAGLAHVETRVSQIQKRLFPWQMLSLVLSFVTGGLLFYMQPLQDLGQGLLLDEVRDDGPGRRECDRFSSDHIPVGGQVG